MEGKCTEEEVLIRQKRRKKYSKVKVGTPVDIKKIIKIKRMYHLFIPLKKNNIITRLLIMTFHPVLIANPC